MSVESAEARDEVQALINEARELGTVTVSRVAEVVESTNLSDDQQEQLLQSLTELGVDIILDEIQSHIGWGGEGP